MQAVRPVRILCAALSLAASVSLAETAYSSLVVKSPFLPPQFNPPGSAGAEAAVPAARSQFEFRGVYQLDGRYYYHLFDHGSRKGKWLSKAMSGNGSPRIVDFNESRNRLVIEVGGEQMELEMQMLEDSSIREQSVDRQGQSSHEVAAEVTGGEARIRRPVIRQAAGHASDPPSRRVLFQQPLTSN